MLDVRRPKPSTDPVEWGTTQQLLAAIFLLQQQQVHAIYTAGTKSARKKPKLNPWPAPKTAEALVKAADVREVFTHLEENVIRSVPAGEYAAFVAEFEASAEHLDDEHDDAAPVEAAVDDTPAPMSLEELRARLADNQRRTGPVD